MADTIAKVRRHRGTVRRHLTRIERDISSLVDKESLTPSDQRKIKRLKNPVKEHDKEFEKRYMEVLDFIEEADQAALDSEEKVFDEHVIRVSDFIERLKKLKDLLATTEPLRPDASTVHWEAASAFMRIKKRLKVGPESRVTLQITFIFKYVVYIVSKSTYLQYNSPKLFRYRDK